MGKWADRTPEERKAYNAECTRRHRAKIPVEVKRAAWRAEYHDRFAADPEYFRERGRNRAEYQAYRDARFRCTNPDAVNWKDYSGRGIQFKFESFEQFFAHIGHRPEGVIPSGRAVYSLDRINNNGHYEIGNVRWATRIEQSANQRPPRKRKQYAAAA